MPKDALTPYSYRGFLIVVTARGTSFVRLDTDAKILHEAASLVDAMQWVDGLLT